MARILAIVVVLTAAGIFSMRILDQIAEVEAETAQLQAQVEIQEYIREEIEDEEAFAQSRAFIERMARSWGFVHRDEIIFVVVD